MSQTVVTWTSIRHGLNSHITTSWIDADMAATVDTDVAAAVDTDMAATIASTFFCGLSPYYSEDSHLSPKDIYTKFSADVSKLHNILRKS